MTSVEMRHISKRFGQYLANDDISINIPRGEIHAIVGENGAGKSTLMKILYGYHVPDSGTIHVYGKAVNISSPANAIALGIGMVHQHFMLIPALNIMENIILGNEPTKSHFILNIGEAREHVRSLAALSGFSVDPGEKVQNLAIGHQQRVEILKVLYRKADIIIFDEPTPLLTPQEVDSFLKSLLNLKNEGKTIILITHKLNEVFTVSDHLTVLRQGKAIRSMKTDTTNPAEVARLMTGQDLPASPSKITSPNQATILHLKNISLRGRNNQTILKDINLSLKSGEILGIAGVEGNGQTPLVQILLGLQKPTSGEIEIHLEDKFSGNPIFSHIPDDRLKNGIINEFDVQENLILGRQNELELSVKSIFRKKGIEKFSVGLIHNYNIQPPNRHLKIRNLSGGNQQKAVVARELSKKSAIIIANQPTRGLDIKAIDFVHSNLIQERNAGRAIILISSDLSELLKLSDRIAVLFEGSVTAILEASETSDQELGLYMTGVRKQSA